MRCPDAIARCMTLYCIVRERIGSKNLWTYRMNRTMTPGVIAPSRTKFPPARMTMAIEMPVSVSTVGIITCPYFVALSWEFRLAVAFSSKREMLTRSRVSPWTARTPLMPSASAPLTRELSSLAPMNDFRARGSQTMRIRNSAGTEASVISPRRQSTAISTAAMPIRSTKSPIANTEDSRNSCRAATSPCRRDMSLPTSVLSINDNETRCRCVYIARRMSNNTRSAIRPTMISCRKFAR